MKLKKFFKPLVTVSALSMLLMGCAEDSSNGGGDSTTTPTAQSVFADFLAGFQSTQAENAGAELAFTTKTTDKKPLNVAKDAEAERYLVSLDNVMATYYATFGITGTSTTLLTPQGDNSITGLSGETKIKNYAKVDKGSDTAQIDLTLTNGTVSLYAGMFALMTDAKVKELDAALGDLDEAVELSKGGTDTPDITQIPVETVQNVVDLINGNMYKVAYNSPAQSVEAAFGKAQTLTLAEGNSMKFTEGNDGNFKIDAEGLSFENANPTDVVQTGSVVVFLDEFKNLLNDETETSEDTVKGETSLTQNSNLKITTDTLSNSKNSKAITYTKASAGAETGNKVTYIAIVESTDVIDSSTDSDAFRVLNNKIGTGAIKAEVEAALAELGTIYKVEYSVDTIANLIETFKASEAVTEALKNPKELTTTDDTNYKADINSSTAFGSTDVKVYCLSVKTETPRLVLNKLDGNDTTADNALENYVLKATAKASGGDGTISFTLEQNAEVGVPLYAYCSEAKDRSSSDGDAFDTAFQTGTNYEKLDAFFQALQEEGVVVYSYTKQQ